MFRYPILALGLFIPCLAVAQLSKGEGKSVTLAGKKFSCYLPNYFEVQETPPGVIHKASGTFIIAVKVPSEKKVSAALGLQRSFFEDPRYEILSLTEVGDEKHNQTHGWSWLMRYKIQGYEFERYTRLLVHGDEQYVVIGNYSLKLKNQVVDEVKKVMESFTIH
jgi:hypothetical protein